MFSNLNVGTRLALGFGLLLAILLAIGGMSWMRLSQLHDAVSHLVSDDWEKARITMEMEIRTRDNAMKAARIMMLDNDVAGIDALKAQIAENSRANGAGLEKLETLVREPEPKAYLAQAAEAREKYVASRARVSELAKDPKTQREALALSAANPPRGSLCGAASVPETKQKSTNKKLASSAPRVTMPAARPARALDRGVADVPCAPPRRTILTWFRRCITPILNFAKAAKIMH